MEVWHVLVERDEGRYWNAQGYVRVRLDRDHGFQSIVIINSRAS